MKKILKRSVLCFVMLISLSLIGLGISENAGGGIFVAQKDLDNANTRAQYVETWNEYIGSNIDFPDGSGLESDPYLIETAEQLASIAYDLYISAQDGFTLGDNGTEFGLNFCFFRQTADINMSAYMWEGIGNSTMPFVGEYDGNGHIISGLSATFDEPTEDGMIGLFNYAQGSQIKNVNVKNAYFSGKIERAGGIVAAAADDTTISNCTSDARIEITDGTGDVMAGGIVGNDLSGIKITNCSYFGDIIVSGAANTASAGGIVGESSGTTISNCIFDGSIVENDLQTASQIGYLPLAFAGGIIGGSANYINFCNVLNCIVKGYLKGYFVGGLIGGDGPSAYIYSVRNFSNCVVEALIDGIDENGLAGAFVGYNIDGANNFTACSFIGNYIKYTYYDDEFVFHGANGSKPTLTACYMAASDREKYISSESDDWGQYYRLVPGMNNDLPMQVGLYFIASAAPEMDSSQIVQSLKDKGFVERT